MKRSRLKFAAFRRRVERDWLCYHARLQWKVGISSHALIRYISSWKGKGVIGQEIAKVVNDALYVIVRAVIPTNRHRGGIGKVTKLQILGVFIISSFALCGSLSAHHDSREMYEARAITLKGIVTDYEWSNPHVIVSVMVKRDNGDLEQWHAEILPPSEMLRLGWTKESIHFGEELTLVGYPGRYAQHIMWLEYLVTSHGRKLGREPQKVSR